MQVLRKGEKSMTYRFTFRRDEEILARGEMTSVCCQLLPAPMRAIPIPESIGARIVEAREVE